MYLKLIIVCLFVVGTNAAKTWTYTIEGIETVSNVDYIHIDVNAERVSRGEFAINGNFVLDKEFSGLYKVDFKANIFLFLLMKNKKKVSGKYFQKCSRQRRL